MKKIILLMLAGMLAFASCKKDSIIIDPPPPIDNTRNFVQVNTSVAGQVVDKDNAPVSDAMVSFGTENMMTDANGIFKFENVTVLENRAYVKVEKAGYFHGSRTFFAKKDQRSNVRISLLEKTIHGNVDASGGTVSTPEGVKLEFPANAIADADGNAYMGIVQVAAQYLDPAADNISTIMPGDLRGITTENVEEGLTTYGMVAVELIGSGGELLNVADGKTVSLTMPVGSTQISSAPAEIPLWYFDETNGVWKEEGTATLQGDKYVGDVSHFTFWNCDINWDLIYLDGSVLLDGVSLEGASVCLTFDNNGMLTQACDITNSSGGFYGQVPTNTTFTLTIYGTGFSQCGNQIYTQEIGPFTADVTLDAIDIDGSTIPNNMIDVVGTIVDCDNNPITNGYVKIKNGFYTYYAFTNDGSINFTTLHCGISGDVEITVTDLDGLTSSDVLTFPASNSIDFGQVQACISLPEFMIYEFDGTTFTLTEYIGISLNDSLGTNPDQYIYGQSSSQDYISLTTPGDGVGTFAGGSLWLGGNQNPNGITASNISVTFTQYSDIIGDTCEGTFSADLDLSGGGTTPITGSFKAIRDY